MKLHQLVFAAARPIAFLFGLALIGCKGEQPTDTGDTDADTDADTDSDTDTDVQNDDDFEHANEVDFGAYFEFIHEDDLDDAGDRDFFKLNAAAGDTFVVHAMGATAGEGSPDTVVRIYGPDQTMIGENDDLPFRINGTDAGYVFRAEAPGDYYVEVLEWSDWAGDPAQGGNGWDYALTIYGGWGEIQDGKNDTISEEEQHVATITDETADNEEYSWYGDPWSANIGSTGGYLFTTGVLDTSDDADFFGLNYNPTDEDGIFYPGVIGFSTFPDLASDLDAVLTVYDEAGVEIVSTDATDVTIDYIGMDWDQGILMPVLEPGTYYLEVSDKGGNSSANHWYTILAQSTPYNQEVVTFHDLVSTAEILPSDATDAIMTESTTAGSYYGFLLGQFEDLADTFDSFRLTNGVFEDQYVYVDCSTAANASALEAHVDLVDQTGTVLVSADTQPDRTDDPRIIEYQIPASVTDLYVVIKRDSGNLAAGKSAYYQCYVQSDTTDDSADF